MVIVIPSHHAFKHIKDLPECTGVVAQPTKAQLESVATKRAHLPNLPPEVLLQIIRPLIPTGQIFHFTPTSRGERSLVSVHRLQPEVRGVSGAKPENSSPTLSTLAGICRRLNDVVYDVFYSESQFVFELAAQKLNSQVTCESATIRSCHKLLATTLEGLAPLSARTATYVMNLTLCVSLTAAYPPTAEWRQLRAWMQEIADVIAGTPHELNQLAVDVGIATFRQKRYFTDRLEVDASSGARHMKIKADADTEAAEDISMRAAERLQQLVRPLKCLASLPKLHFSGLSDQQLALRSVGRELQPAKRKHEGEEGDGKASVKRRRAN